MPSHWQDDSDTASTIEVARGDNGTEQRTLAYDEHGAGQPMVFSTDSLRPNLVRPIVERMDSSFRCILNDRAPQVGWFGPSMRQAGVPPGKA